MYSVMTSDHREYSEDFVNILDADDPDNWIVSVAVSQCADREDAENLAYHLARAMTQMRMWSGN